MPKVTFVAPDGTPADVEAPVGVSLMMAALTSGIDGIIAECGGSLACGTCHVHIEPEQLASLPPMAADEDAMLDAIVGERLPNSRLSCQIRLTAEFPHLVVRIPDTQG